MSEEKDVHKLEDLQKDIYTQNFKSELPSMRQHFSQHDTDVDKEWEHTFPDASHPIPQRAPKVVAGSFFKKILVFSVIFFVISAGLLLYMFLGGWNVISASNVDLTFLGPVTIGAGDELSFDIIVDNQNRSAIENATLYIQYPDGTKDTQEITKDLTNDTLPIGEVLAKATARKTSRSILFGELNTHEEIKVAVEYGLKNSNAKFRKEKSYEVTISSTPLTIMVVHPQTVISNDSVRYDVTVTSNSSVPLTNILVKADYPFGFTYADADPKPDYDTNYWLIPTLNPGEKRDFSVTGQIQGQQNDERVVRFSVGAQDATDQRKIATQYLSQPESVFVQRPPIDISLDLNGSSLPVYTAQQGDLILGKVTIVNNLDVEVIDPQINLLLKGELYDPTTVSGGSGFFQSINNTIVWDKRNLDSLASLKPGQKISVAFSFRTKSATTVIKNGTMTLNATVSGNRVSNTDVTTLVSSAVTKSIRTQTSIAIVPQIVYSTGPFKNRGPIPPKADSKTTYTVTWTATNSSNDARGTEVRATLPVNVHWLDVTTPSSESITFNSDNNEVLWRVGDLTAGTGTAKPARSVTFQIEFAPGLGDVGTQPVLVSGPEMTATDSFTNAALTAHGKEVSTRLTNDPKYNGQEAPVTQ